MTVLQMTLPGAPCVYYGDEIGLYGERDPDCRRGMPWDKETWNLELLEFTTKAIAVRNQVSALRQGSYKTLYAKDMTLVFERKLGDSYAVVVLNAGQEPQKVTLEDLAQGIYHEHFSGFAIQAINGVLTLEVPGRTGQVFIAG